MQCIKQGGCILTGQDVFSRQMYVEPYHLVIKTIGAC